MFRPAGVFRVGVARRCAKVVSMVMDVGVISMAMGWEEKGGGRWGGGGVVLRWPRSRDQGRGESDCSHPDRKSKTSTPRGEAREKGAISRAKLLRGWRREKYHSNNSIRRDQREGGRERGREFWAEGQRVAARKTPRHVEQSRDARKGDGPAACYLDGPLVGGVPKSLGFYLTHPSAQEPTEGACKGEGICLSH